MRRVAGCASNGLESCNSSDHGASGAAMWAGERARRKRGDKVTGSLFLIQGGTQIDAEMDKDKVTGSLSGRHARRAVQCSLGLISSVQRGVPSLGEQG